jgi:hypothetical protein
MIYKIIRKIINQLNIKNLKWKEYKPKDWKIKVCLPDEINLIKIEIEKDLQEDNEGFYIKSKPSWYAISRYKNIKEGKIDLGRIKNLLDENFNSLSLLVVDEKEIKVRNYRVKDFILGWEEFKNYDSFTFRVRFYFTDNYTYSLGVFAYSPFLTKADINTFLDSFDLLQ